MDLWEGGVAELVPGHAMAWTNRGARGKFGASPPQHEVWVWVVAIERA